MIGTDFSTDTSRNSDRTAVVIVASTRAARGEYEDATGPVIVEWLETHDWVCGPPRVVPDGQAVADALAAAVDQDARVIITTGGTGLSPDDVTGELTQTMLDKEIPGFMEELRRRGAQHKPTALLTRGHAGVIGSSVVVNLPGSPGGVRDGLDILNGILEHAIDQLTGGHAGH